MSEARSCDAVVIGASVGGLAAAAYLAGAGLSVVLLEAADTLGGVGCATLPFGEGFTAAIAQHALTALDPKIVKDLKLARRGLGFALRDMALVGLRPDGRHVVVSRDTHATARGLAIHAREDSEAWPQRRRALFSLARKMRAHWWEANGASAAEVFNGALNGSLEPFRRMGAAAWLDSQFESDALKATLAFDAMDANLSTHEPGSALALLWRAAQEMCGFQGVPALAKGGPAALRAALVSAAQDAGVEIRTGARATRIHVIGHTVAGVELASGNLIATRRVLSSLSPRATLCDLLPGGEAGLGLAGANGRSAPRVGAATVVLKLSAQPVFGGIATPAGARFVIADRLASYAVAHAAAELGEIPHEPPIALNFPSSVDPSVAPPGQHLLTAVIRPLPLAPSAGWEASKPVLLDRLYRAIAPHAPAIESLVTQAEIVTPADFTDRFAHEQLRASVTQMLSPWQQRIATPIAGLMLCGASAEPVASISGRAGRIAAALALKEAKQ